jgi:hypothetical protein
LEKNQLLYLSYAGVIASLTANAFMEYIYMFYFINVLVIYFCSTLYFKNAYHYFKYIYIRAPREGALYALRMRVCAAIKMYNI